MLARHETGRIVPLAIAMAHAHMDAPELEAAFRIHASMDSCLGGVHFELTGENVTECTGGARGLTDADLARAYRSQVDPRLNYEQALELAMRIAGLHEGRKKRSG